MPSRRSPSAGVGRLEPVLPMLLPATFDQAFHENGLSIRVRLCVIQKQEESTSGRVFVRAK